MIRIALSLTLILLVLNALPQKSELAGQESELAMSEFSNGNHEAALNHFLEAIELETNMANPDSAFIGLSYYYIGYLYHLSVRISKAIQYYDLALETVKSINEKEGEQMVLKMLGKIYLAASDYPEALKYYQKSYQIAVELDNVYEQEICLSDIGLVYYYTGKHKEALENFNMALELTKQMENKPEQSVAILNNIGLVYFTAGEYQQALHYYTKAVDIHDSLELTGSLSVQLINIALSYNYLGEQGKSIEFYNQALSEAKKRGDKKDEAQIISYLGLAYYQWGMLDLALESHQKSLEIYEMLNMDIGIARSKNNIALVFTAKGENAKAITYYEESLIIIRDQGDLMGVATILSNIGESYRNTSKYEAALDKYNESLKISRSAGLQNQEAISLNNIGLVYFAKGNYQNSINYFKEALGFFHSSGNIDYTSTALNNIGLAYKMLGEFEMAIKNLDEAYVFGKNTGYQYGQATAKNNIGLVNTTWGKFDYAMEYFTEALNIAKDIGIKNMEATIYNNIGQLYYNKGNYDEADSLYQKAYNISVEIDDKSNQALALNNAGVIFFSEYNFSTALDLFTRALQLNEESGTEESGPFIYNNIGQIYSWRDSYDTALIYYEKSLQVAQKTNDLSAEAGALNSIGTLYSYTENYAGSVKYYEAALAIKEQLRNTVAGDIKRDFLSENLFFYNNLILAYLELQDYENAFRINEQSKARFLIEQLSQEDSTYYFENSIDYSAPENSTIISYANSNYSNKIVFVMNHKEDSVIAIEISDTAFFANDFNKTYQENDLAYVQKRGARLITMNDVEKDKLSLLVKDENFEEIVNYYRYLLSDPGSSNQTIAGKIGRALYDYLIKPVEGELTGSDNLIIVPDGALSNIPFESLIDEDGKYLAEKYNIRYTPSLTTLNYLNTREYTEKKSGILAIGNPDFEMNYHQHDTIKTEPELIAFKKQVDYSIRENELLGQYYADLGYGYWPSLPGTGDEIEKISNIFNKADVVTGAAASEKNIRDISNSGKLKDYKVIHFATHGITIPEVPELSALVLTQTESDTVDDGFLTMGEIANLDLEADFVNLSACETGLGKIYGGEGVVGLTQSFMVAGANGLAVSLWQVADESTALFMTEMYKLASDNKMSYAEAMAEIKRRFIKGEYGEKYTHPFYWGPFVYYGRE